jgi:flagellar FliL protein
LAEEEKELVIEDNGKKKKMIIIIAAVVVLAVAGGLAFMFMGSGSSDVVDIDSGAPSQSSGEKADSSDVGSALYVPMPRPFTFNVPGAVRDRTVQIRVQLLVRGGDNEETAKKNIPLVESVLLNVFQQANADDLATHAGKKALRQKSLIEIQKTLDEMVGKKLVEQVLFTGFVMQ